MANLIHTVEVGDRVDKTSHSVSLAGNILDLAAALIAVGLLALYYTGQSGTPRILLALAFAFFVPGRAVVANWPRMAGWSEVAMPMVLSLALLTVLAMSTLWAHAWKPTDLFQVEAWLSLAGLCIAMLLRNRSRAHHLARQPRGWPGEADND